MGSACFPRWRFWSCFDGVTCTSGVSSGPGTDGLAQRFPSFIGVSNGASALGLGWATFGAAEALELATAAGGAGAAFAAVLFGLLALGGRFAASISSSVASIVW